jgi:4-hydroxybenzoate polyprenyltransferase
MARPSRPIAPPLPRARRWRRLLLAGRIVHPAPSLVVAAAVAAVAWTAGAGAAVTVMLVVAMLGFQFSIGALNDLADADADRAEHVAKPISYGAVSTRTAIAIVLVGTVVGLTVSASFGPLVLLLGAAGWSCGVAYDLVLRRLGLGWIAFVLALPLLLAWTWSAVGAPLPATWPLMLAVAALAGPTLHLANSLVDLERDARAGRRTLATRTEARASRLTLSLLVGAILLLTLLAVARSSTTAAVLAYGLGATLALFGLGLAWGRSWQRREAGWLLLASAMIPMTVAWLAD